MVEVQEQYIVHLAGSTSPRLMASMRGSAVRFTATLKNTLKSGGDTYTFENVTVQTDVKGRGGQGSAGITAASGKVLRNGKPFGECILQSGKVLLETDSGTIPLDLPAR